jgi:diaminohydroxyphosphoribosylaminopyrimidine deaminase / 5-amino-6-(5-phosphoribosylamino)uracil reductase
MKRCLDLATQGIGHVAPNPMVGAVLVHEDRIIGEGFHQQYGQAHAEVNCIHSVKKEDQSLISKSTIFVSLEPCAHFGKTPPCADLIIEKKIPKVVIGCRDPFEEVDGKGIEKLKAAGIEVVCGVLEKECTEMNKRFFTFHNKKRPYIILKWAESNNAKIAHIGGERILISNEFSNRLVHKWRAEEAAILVGTNTALKDNPELTTRLWKGPNPIRILIDLELIIPSSFSIFNKEARTIIFNNKKNEEEDNLLFYKLDTKENSIQAIINALYILNLQSVLVEGGSKTLQSFIDSGLWDEARIIQNNGLMIENGPDAPELKHAQWLSNQKIATDTISYYQNSIS